jgi:glycosyltransferase involved in cell wall biosynthesis
VSIYLSIVIPLYNEEESIAILVSDLYDVCSTFQFEYEIILVDDGSKDSTWVKLEKLKKEYPKIKGIKLRRNFGQTSAMVAGFDYSKGEVIVTLDGDLQNDPKSIPLLIEKINEGYDIVSGWRKNRKDHFSRVLTSKVANKIISATTGVKLHDYGCSLKAYRASCIQAIRAYGEMHRFFPALASMTGSNITEVVVKHHPRKFGSSKYGFDRIFKVFSDIISMNLIIRFSSSPLAGFVITCLPFLVSSIFFLLVSMLAFMLNWTDNKATFFLILTILTIMSILQLVGLGIISELVVNTSDLIHTRLPEVTMRKVKMENNEEYKD